MGNPGRFYKGKPATTVFLPPGYNLIPYVDRTTYAKCDPNHPLAFLRSHFLLDVFLKQLR